MVKKDNYFTCYKFFCSFTLLVCGEKTILPRSRSRVFLAPWSRSRSKKNTRSRSRLGKKLGAGAANKFVGSPALQLELEFSAIFNFKCN